MDLTFRGMVERIQNARLGIRGGLVSRPQPVARGLEVGTTCTITARWVGDGYTVDEHQWHGAP